MDKGQFKRLWGLTALAAVLFIALVGGAFMMQQQGRAPVEPKFGIDLRIIAGIGLVLYLLAVGAALSLRQRSVNAFCTIAFWEAVSYLVLLLIAMPLKYAADLPLAVKYVGWAHGALFIFYMLLLTACWLREGWRWYRVAGYFIASLLPFVPFWVEVHLKREIKQRKQTPDTSEMASA